MKKNGQQLSSLRKDIIVFPRGTNPKDFLDFTVQAIPDFEPFRKQCKVDAPPWSMDASGDKKYNWDDKGYKEKVAQHNKLFEAWLIINSIWPHTDWLEWEKVKPNDKSTWLNWSVEMAEAGISAGERDRLVEKVQAVNSLNDQSIQEAMGSFLAMLRSELEKSTGQAGDLQSTSSTELASDSDSSQQESEFPAQDVGTS